MKVNDSLILTALLSTFFLNGFDSTQYSEEANICNLLSIMLIPKNISSTNTANIYKAIELKKVLLGHISFEVPEYFQVKTFFDKGAEITLNGERIAGVGLNKYEPSIPLENMIGNYIKLAETKLNGYNFSEAYRLDVEIEYPYSSGTSIILRTVHFIFIDKENNTTIKLSFDSNFTDEKILGLISKSVKVANKTR